MVEAVDKKRARLDCIGHLLTQMPCDEVPHPPVNLPGRVRHDDCERHPIPPEMYVPERF